MRNFRSQEGRFIQTLHPNKEVEAYIFDQQQRDKIYELMSQGYYPHHSSVGKGVVSAKEPWKVEEYKGRLGEGYKMITYSVYSSNFNHLTYFFKAI